MMARITEACSGGADALKEAGADQHGLGRSHAAEDRGGREDDESAQEDAFTSGQVAETAGQEQQASEGDKERVYDPGEVGLGEVELVLDRGQGDVHDGHVEHDHQLGQADDSERGPAAGVGRRAWG